MSEKHDYALLKIAEFVDRQEYFKLSIPLKNEEVTVCGFSKVGDTETMFYDSSLTKIEGERGLHDSYT